MDDSSTQPESSGAPKKRRFTRVSRACVECRLRKIRCDARQPCEACEDFNRRCVYSSTKAQRTGGAPRTKILEDRLRRARALIAQMQAEHPSVKHRTEIDAIFDTPPGSPDSGIISLHNEDVREDDLRGDLENMMDGQGAFTASDQSNPIYYGGQSGFKFLEKTQQLFQDDGDANSPDKPAASPNHVALSQLFDAPLPDRQALSSRISINRLLPPKPTALKLLTIFFEQTYQLLQFVNVQWFHEHTERIYDMDPNDYTDMDHDFLPLFLGVIAIGYLFDTPRHRKHSCRRTIDQAMRHFIAARHMIDVTKCHDLVALQTIVTFALFLLSSARLATAHTYVALAAAAAMRMGLHSQTTCGSFSEEENESRARLLWTIVKLDIYTGTILGLPGLVNLSHVDQVRPSGSIEDYKTSPDGSSISRDQQRVRAASAQYRDLLLIIANMVQKLFPKTEHEAKQVRRSKKMLINSAVITDTERQFKEWRDGIQTALGVPDNPESPSWRSTLYELRMAHNLGHILLYRPFLHYLARPRSDNQPDHRQLRCANECIKIARETIAMSDQMLAQGYLAPGAWQSVYTIFLAVVALIFYLGTSKILPHYEAVEKEAVTGIRVLASTSCQDIGSRRCLDVLKVLTRRLSHIVNLDIEEIEQQTQSSCQTDGDPVSRASLSVSPLTSIQDELFSDSPVQMSSTQPAASTDFIDHAQHQPHMIPSNAPTAAPSTQLSTSHPHSEHSDMRIQQQQMSTEPSRSNSHSTYDFGHPAMRHDSHTSSSTMHDAAMSSSGYNQDYYMHQTDMEVPFSDTFAWPFDPNINSMNQLASATQSMHMPGSDFRSDPNMHPHNGYDQMSMSAHPQLRAQHSGSQHMHSNLGTTMQQHHGTMHPSQRQQAHVSTSLPGMGSGAMQQNQRGGRHPGQHGRGTPQQGQQNMPDNYLTSEDIAAFMMRISPGEEPFL